MISFAMLRYKYGQIDAFVDISLKGNVDKIIIMIRVFNFWFII